MAQQCPAGGEQKVLNGMGTSGRVRKRRHAWERQREEADLSRVFTYLDLSLIHISEPTRLS